jgi:hypothetical protein
MIFFLALIPATMLSVAGLVAFFLSQRSEGGIRTVGRYLGFWAFTLAVLVVLASIILAARAPHMRGIGPRFRPMAAPTAPAASGAPAIPEQSPAPAAGETRGAR